DRSEVFTATPLDRDAPIDLAEARNAIALARIAGADQYGGDSCVKATRLLAEAERARHLRQDKDVIMAARQAAQTAEDARLIAVQRQEQAATARQRVAAAPRERHALGQAQ